MKNLKAKLRKNGGFTLVEMLIVVAIIAILVAVSIPLVSTSLEKAKDATDDANLRAAKAEAVIMYMNDQMDGTATLTSGMAYDITTGTFVATATGYNQGKLGSNVTAKSQVIKVTLTGNATTPVTVAWATP